MSGTFRPFLNAARVPPQAAEALARLLVGYEQARRALMLNPTPEAVVAYLEAYGELAEEGELMQQRILTLPVIVHIAAEREWEPCPESDEAEHQHLVQRCVRCGSELLGFVPGTQAAITADGIRLTTEEDYSWYPTGSRVAKHVNADESAAATFALDNPDSEAPLRPLEAWEHECIAISDMMETTW